MSPRNPLDLSDAVQRQATNQPRHPREGFWWGFVIGTILLLALLTPCAGLDLREQDKQAHLIGGALLGYVIDESLERATDQRPWARRLTAILAVAAIGATYEMCVGYADPEDAAATALGGCVGVGTRATVHLLISPRSESVSIAMAINL